MTSLWLIMLMLVWYINESINFPHGERNIIDSCFGNDVINRGDYLRSWSRVERRKENWLQMVRTATMLLWLPIMKEVQ